MPLDRAGTIDEANEAAARLLNVAATRLPGKPLALFVSNRQAFFKAIETLRGRKADAADLRLSIRPRERRVQWVLASGHRLEHDTRLCWLLQPVADSVARRGGEHALEYQSGTSAGRSSPAAGPSSAESGTT